MKNEFFSNKCRFQSQSLSIMPKKKSKHSPALQNFLIIPLEILMIPFHRFCKEKE